MTREARRSFRVSGLSIENINFTLGLIADRMDEMEGRRGAPEFKSNVDMNNNKLKNVGAATEVSEAVVLSQVQSAWPVGSIFISVVATNPANLLGFGTWAAFGTGKMLVGVNVADADFNSVEKTGGAKTVDLSHTHSTPAHTHPAGTIVQAGTGVQVNDGNGGAGTTSSGGNAGQTILNPYITAYFWKRTA